MLFRSSDTNISLKFVTDAAVSWNSSSTAWATIGGFLNGQKVYRTDNGGSTWYNISGSLPNVPVNCIVTDPNSTNGIYIGTDLGVYYRDDNSTDWVPFQNGLPNIEVMDLAVNNYNGTITAATFGRGLWVSSLYSQCNVDFVHQNGTGSNPRGLEYYAASNSITSYYTLKGRHWPIPKL